MTGQYTNKHALRPVGTTGRCLDEFLKRQSCLLLLTDNNVSASRAQHFDTGAITTSYDQLNVRSHRPYLFNDTSCRAIIRNRDDNLLGLSNSRQLQNGRVTGIAGNGAHSTLIELVEVNRLDRSVVSSSVLEDGRQQFADGACTNHDHVSRLDDGLLACFDSVPSPIAMGNIPGDWWPWPARCASAEPSFRTPGPIKSASPIIASTKANQPAKVSSPSHSWLTPCPAHEGRASQHCL